jgi:hypothetical protein
MDIIVGWDARQPVGAELFAFSAMRRTSVPLPRPWPLMEKALRHQGLYRRPHERRGSQLWCPISDAPLSTPFANSRFLVPWIAKGQWALYADGVDMMFYDDPAELFALADERYAIQVVKMAYTPTVTVKMDGQAQTSYERKGWSSLVLWNLDHPAHRQLTLADVNERPGRDLHGFFWLADDEIGALPASWNYLIDAEGQGDGQPQLLHYTLGTPEIAAGRVSAPWKDVWLKERAIMDAYRDRMLAARAAAA